MSQPFLKSLKIKNLLSFGGGEGFSIDLKPLNVLIGPNGSGKSNLIQCLKLLKNCDNSERFLSVFRNGGGSYEWLWKNADGDGQSSTVEAAYCESGKVHSGHLSISFAKDSRTTWLFDSTPSVKAELKEQLAFFSKFMIYENYGQIAKGSGTDLPPDFLMENGENVGLIMNVAEHAGWKDAIVEELRGFNNSVVDYNTLVIFNSIMPFIHEDKDGEIVKISLPRVSNGTVRYLCLLAILLHPNPPPLICIEEPELGLHPDIIMEVARLLKEASKRTQLIVTTHSRKLIDCFSDDPESVVVCEQGEHGETKMNRLVTSDLEVWLEQYSLGKLWSSGEIGGNRW